MWHGEKKNKNKTSSQLLDMPPNSHLKTRLQYNRYLSGSLRRKTTGKQLCTDVIRSGENSKKKNLFYIFSVRTDWKPTHHVLVLFSWRRFCRVDLKFDFPFFFLEKCILVLQPCISVLAYPLGFNFFLFFTSYLKHYSMMLLSSKTAFILSPPPLLKLCVCI